MSMDKPYTWKEVRKLLIRELSKTKNIMTFGTIGSCDVKNDIDIVITKRPNSKSSDFYREIHSLFDSINKYMYEKYNSKLIRLHGLSFQGEILNSVDVDNNDLILHTFVYVSLPQIKNEWKPWSSEDEDVVDLLKNTYSCLIGDKNDLFNNKFSKEKYYDFMFTFLWRFKH